MITKNYKENKIENLYHAKRLTRENLERDRGELTTYESISPEKKWRNNYGACVTSINSGTFGGPKSDRNVSKKKDHLTTHTQTLCHYIGKF